MSVELMAMDLSNNIEELTAELYLRYCSYSAALTNACNADLTSSSACSD